MSDALLRYQQADRTAVAPFLSLERSVRAARLIGGRALMVNAVDDEAALFWRKRGFLPSKDDPMTMFRSIGDLAVSVAAVTY